MTSNYLAGAPRAGRSLPSWAVDVLATPGDKQPIVASDQGLATRSGQSIEFADALVDLSGLSKHELQQHTDSFVANDAEAVEFLKPRQQLFRRLLWRFARQLRPDATVADIAAADAEFVCYYPTRRVLAMDLSVARLRRGVEQGRVDFGVLADIRRPPLLDGALDAIVSSNTLHHLPDDEVPEIVAGLVRCLKPGGRLAATVGTTTVPGVIERIGWENIVEHESIGGPVSGWWERVIYPRTSRLARRGGSRAERAAKPLLDFVSSSVALGDRLFASSESMRPGLHWFVIQAPWVVR